MLLLLLTFIAVLIVRLQPLTIFRIKIVELQGAYAGCYNHIEDMWFYTEAEAQRFCEEQSNSKYKYIFLEEKN